MAVRQRLPSLPSFDGPFKILSETANFWKLDKILKHEAGRRSEFIESSPSEKAAVTEHDCLKPWGVSRPLRSPFENLSVPFPNSFERRSHPASLTLSRRLSRLRHPPPGTEKSSDSFSLSMNAR
jgi:hypothetical protein